MSRARRQWRSAVAQDPSEAVGHIAKHHDGETIGNKRQSAMGLDKLSEIVQ